MAEILSNFLPIIKEFAMQYGLWETMIAFVFVGVSLILAWRLPNILSVIKDWRK